MNRPPGLVATRSPLEPGPAVDPYALAGGDGTVFVSEGRVLVGLGRALELALPHGLEAAGELEEAVSCLASIPCHDLVAATLGRADPSAGAGVLALGALPFDRSAAASLVVPELLFVREPTGAEWVTTVTRAGVEPPGRDGLRAWLRSRSARQPATTAGSDRAPALPPEIASSSAGDPECFEAMVDAALTAIHRGDLDKVVLARNMEVRTAGPIDIIGLLRRWHHLEPDCALFSVPGPEGQFVGASPELLVRRDGLRVRSRPLAGTTFRRSGTSGPTPGDGEPTAEEATMLPPELLASAKDGAEHRLVVEAIAGRLAPLCSELDVPAAPDLVQLHNLVHLGTAVAGSLARRDRGGVPSALDLVAVLHPTPAVGGVPTEAARSLIEELEPRSRHAYAGPVGYVDASGDGTWVLGIRAVSIRDRTARLTAGVGIVDGSDARAELAETNLKFNAVLDALTPGFRLPMPADRRSRARPGVRAFS